MQRLPVVTIVGRPNVGKSMLFNRLTGTRAAVVEDTPGVTRDRLYGVGDAFGKPFRLIDTGGLDSAFDDDITLAAQAQAEIAIDEADVVLFMIDGRDGVNAVDLEIADRLRRIDKPILVVANKLESLKRASLETAWDLHLGEALPISALHGTQVGDLLERLNEVLPDVEELAEDEDDDRIHVAVVGRPNVGKSSLVNGILGEQRVIVSDVAGTTRDAIDTAFERGGREYVLIDTAGIRRKSRVKESLEYYSVLRSMGAIERSTVTVLVLDALDGATDQDKRLAGMAHEAGRGLIIVVNKWDRFIDYLENRDDPNRMVEAQLEPRLARTTPRTALRDYAKILRLEMPFCSYAPIIFTTAIRGEGVAKVLAETDLVAEHHTFRVPTPELNNVVRETLDERPPHTRHGQRLKVLYATQVRVKPPTIVFFVNDPELVHFSFKRFMENRLREVFNFEGTPLRLLWRARREDGGRSRRRTREADEATTAGGESRPTGVTQQPRKVGPSRRGQPKTGRGRSAEEKRKRRGPGDRGRDSR